MANNHFEDRTFVSYTTPYDHYVGEREIGELSPKQQDELIKVVLDTEGDFRKLVVEWNVKKAQVEGLWSVVVFVGMALEHAGRIKDFTTRSAGDIQEIISFLTSTKLAIRLEEAYPPFDFRESKSEYDWRELEKVEIDVLTDVPDDLLLTAKSKVCKYLKSHYTDLNTDFIHRIPFHVFKKYYDDRKLELVVDKGLSISVARSGVLSSIWPSLLALAFTALIIGFIPIWYFFGAWYGVFAFAVAIACKRVSSTLVISEVRKLAITDKKLFGVFLARHIIWLKPVRQNRS